LRASVTKTVFLLFLPHYRLAHFAEKLYFTFGCIAPHSFILGVGGVYLAR
jgi:hypothetical protein